MKSTSPQMKVVRIEKQSSLTYVSALLESYRGESVALPTDVNLGLILPGMNVVETVYCQPGGGWFSEKVAPRTDDTPAQISLTSGSTGVPAQILLSHRNLADVATRLIDVMGLDETIREYIGVPVTHSFGFARVRAIAAVGGASFLPSDGFRIDELATMLRRGEVNALSAVPTLLRLLLNQREQFADIGRTLRWLEIGSQTISADEKEAVRTLFPNAQIVQHYGMTEASRSTFLSISDVDASSLSSIGRPNGAVEVDVSSQGLIRIRGPHIGQIVKPEGVLPLVDEEGWLQTRDLGHLENGLLYFDGRADDLINVGGIKVAAALFEERLISRLRSSVDVAVARGSDALRGETVVVAYAASAKPDAVALLHREAKNVARETSIGDGFTLLPVSYIPRTETHKVRRGQITALFDNRLAVIAPPAQDKAGGVYADEVVAQAFVSVFGESARDDRASFKSLGGDSLGYVMVAVELEAVLGELPEDWTDMSIAALIKLAESRSASSSSPNDIVIQAFVSVFGESARDDGASFKSLGGDSLGYVMVAVELEAVLGELPEDWTGMSIAALIELAEHRASHDPRQATRRLPLNLDTLRAIACVLVVIYHVVGPNAKTGLKLPMSSGWHHFAESFEFIRMPLFTVMAGFLYAAMPATNEGLTSFLHRRAKILLVPLVTATIISVVSRDVAYGAGDNLIQAFIHGYMHLWFVYALMIWYIIAGLLDTYVSQSPRFWATMLFIAPVVWALTPMIEVISLSSALRHFVFFIFGILLYRSPSILLSNKILAVSAILAVTLLLLQQIYLYGIVNLGKLEQPVGFVAGCAIVLVLIRVFPRIKAIESLGVYSFTIYLYHPWANALARMALRKLGIPQVPILFSVGLIVGIALPLLMHRALLHGPKWLRIPIIGR